MTDLVTFYRAFGIETDAEPHQRSEEVRREDSAVNECDTGIHRIEVRALTYGDDRDSALVDVIGIDQREVLDTWYRVVRSGAWKTWWPR